MSKIEGKKKAMIEALEKSLGVVTNAAKAIGISRHTHYAWMQNDVEYKNEVDQISNFILDFAESQLFKQINDGNIVAILFYLKTKGKSRGFVEKTEIRSDNELIIKFQNGNYFSESAQESSEGIKFESKV
jgi:isopentenyldiphosphate isomerase